MKILFIDTIGLRYNATTVYKRGLGGSESAIIYLTNELNNLGFEVTVLNKLEGMSHTKFNNVRYVDLEDAKSIQYEKFDIIIGSRNATIFAPLEWKDDYINEFGLDIEPYNKIIKSASYRVLWLHDTFCMGDEDMQVLLADGFIDKVFTLTDWHSNYISNGIHLDKDNLRHPGFMKNKMFYTRNGAINRNPYVSLEDKDEMLFVYNSSITKGMVPLIEEVWPLVIKKYPEAKLKVIGGYYSFKDDSEDSFEKRFHDLKEKNDGKNNVLFTGIISQQEISDILKEATYFLYPNIYPETFGISVTEAILNNVIPITCNFGGLEEIAINDVSYNIEFNYDLDSGQLDRMFMEIVKAVEDPFLRRNKQQKCDEYKPFLGWDVVALQWKNHFFKVLDKYMPINETFYHRYNMENIYRMYGKHYQNPEDQTINTNLLEETPIVIISPVYNAEEYIENCIRSVASQGYKDYMHFIIDDMSTDNTKKVAIETINTLNSSIRGKFVVMSNATKKYAVGNQIETIDRLTGDPIIMLLDGDDTLVNDPDIFNYINKEYLLNGLKFTYGSCRSMADKIDLIAQEYPPNVKETKTFRWHKFDWGMPFTHLRTFKKSLLDNVDRNVFKDENNEYWKVGGDNAMFYPLIEQCKMDEIKAIKRVLVNYNDLNPINDYKVHAKEQNEQAELIVKSKHYQKEG